MLQQFVLYFSLGFILLCLVVNYMNKHSDMVFVESAVDGKQYIVRNLPDKQRAADILATLAAKMKQLADHVWSIRDSQDEFCELQIDALKRRFDPGKISEAPSDSSHTSYSLNKEKIFLCIRSKSDPSAFVDLNTLLYVVAHEISHIASIGVGHGDFFWKNFSFILREAVKLGIYKHVDYSKNPQAYCGITISSSAYDPNNDKLEEILKTPNTTQSCR